MSFASRITTLADRIGDECKLLWTAIAGKQATLVSGTNIKTINSTSLLGSGNITISGGSGASAPVVVTPDASNVSTIDLTAGNYFNLDLEEIAGTSDISVVGTPVATSFGSSTTGTLNLPTGLQEGDVVICAIGSDGGTNIGLPSGWTAVLKTTYSTEYQHTFYKVMGSSPDSSVALTGLLTASVGISIAFRNVHYNIFDAATVATSGATGMPNSPSITTVSANSMILAIGFLDDDSAEASVTVPSGYSNLTVKQSTTAGQTVMLATKLKTTAGAEDPAAFGGTGTDEWIGLTIALKKAVLLPSVVMSNVPASVVSDIKVRVASSTNRITFPASFSWGWNPDFKIFTDTILNLTTDDSGTTWKVAPDIPLNKFIDKTVVSALNIDWGAGAIFTKAITGNSTFTFSNLQLNKVITVIISSGYTVSWPAFCKKISGDFDTAVTNYVQLHCTNATPGSEEVWRVISKETT